MGQVKDKLSLAGRPLGGFDVLEKIGEGGMGSVYRARQRSLGRTVALKVLDMDLAARPIVAERFRREARAAARLDHPHVVQPFDFGEEQGILFFAMELMEGGSASSRIAQKGPFAERDALEIGLAVTRALAYARTFALVHRDVKPDNILFSKHGTPKLADLGLVFERAQPGVTEHGIAMGSPHYMSPEQALGQRDLDSRSDIYSLGITLFEMLSGRRPFEAQNPALILTQHVSTPMPDLKGAAPGVSDATAELVRRMTLKRREDRYQTPDELATAMEEVLATFPPKGPISSSAATREGAAAQPRPGRFRRGFSAAAAMVVLGVAVATVAWVARHRAETGKVDPAAEAALAERLRDLLLSRQAKGGGYSYAYDARSDPWTNAQAFTAFGLGAPEKPGREHLESLLGRIREGALDADLDAATPQGWPLAPKPDDNVANMEASGWVAIALAVAGDGWKSAGARDRERARRYLLSSQREDGSYASVPPVGEKGTRTSATAIALTGLIALGTRGGPDLKLTEAVERSARWLGQSYDKLQHCWYPNPRRAWGNRRRIDGLPEHCAWALLEAELFLRRLGRALPEEAVAAIDDFAAATEGADLPPETLSQSENEDYIFPLPDGVRSTPCPVRWVYYPWRLLVCERLAAQRPHHPKVKAWRAEAARLRRRGLGLARAIQDAHTFQVAETLFGVNLLSKRASDDPECGSLFLYLVGKT